MKNLTLTILFLTFLYSVKGQQTIAICKEKYGCDIAIVTTSRAEIDKILEKPNFLSVASKNAILVLQNCNSIVEEKRTLQQLHASFGGKGLVKENKQFDLKKYLIEKGCYCPNTTKKVSFKLTSPEFNGTGYCYINLQKGEAFMPNAAFQQLYKGQEGFSQMVIDAYFRNYKYITYMIDPEGKKVKMNMNIGISVGGFKNDKLNLAKWKKDFKATGKKRKHFNTTSYQYEYVGNTPEGKLTFWLVQSGNVCLPAGKFDALGFWNLGYIAFDGKTYLVTELSGSGFKVEVTNITDGTYNFNPVGYQSMGSIN